MRFLFALLVLPLLVSFASAQDTQITLTTPRTAIRRGERLEVVQRLRVPVAVVGRIELFAVATWEHNGVTYTTESNRVTLTVINPVTLQVKTMLSPLTYVSNSATFDGAPITPTVGSTGVGFTLTVEDDEEHTLRFEVTYGNSTR